MIWFILNFIADLVLIFLNFNRVKSVVKNFFEIKDSYDDYMIFEKIEEYLPLFMFNIFLIFFIPIFGFLYLLFLLYQNELAKKIINFLKKG